MQFLKRAARSVPRQSNYPTLILELLVQLFAHENSQHKQQDTNSNEQKEKEFCNRSGCAGNPGKTKQSGNQCDNQKY